MVPSIKNVFSTIRIYLSEKWSCTSLPRLTLTEFNLLRPSPLLTDRGNLMKMFIRCLLNRRKRLPALRLLQCSYREGRLTITKKLSKYYFFQKNLLHSKYLNSKILFYFYFSNDRNWKSRRTGSRILNLTKKKHNERISLLLRVRIEPKLKAWWLSQLSRKLEVVDSFFH